MNKRTYYHGQTKSDYERRDQLMSSSTCGDELYDRLVSCGTLSEGTFGWERKCNLPACPYCRAAYARKACKAALADFDGAINEELGMATLVAGATTDVEEIGAMFIKARSDLRNMINRQRAERRRWRNFKLIGWLEVDALAAEDLPNLGSDRSALLHGLGLPHVADGDTIWIPTIHAAVWFRGMDWQEVRDVLSHQWPMPHQAHLQLSRPHLTVEQNIKNIVNYSLKHKCQTTLGHSVVEWPAAWLGQYYTWLHSWTPGFRQTRVVIKRAGSTNHNRSSRQQDNENTSPHHLNSKQVHADNYVEPMPIII